MKQEPAFSNTRTENIVRYNLCLIYALVCFLNSSVTLVYADYTYKHSIILNSLIYIVVISYYKEYNIGDVSCTYISSWLSTFIIIAFIDLFKNYKAT